MIDTFVEWRAAGVAQLSTKGDVLALRGDVEAGCIRLERDIAALDTKIEARLATMTAELRAEISQSKVDLLKWFVPLFAGQILALLALVVQLLLRGP